MLSDPLTLANVVQIRHNGLLATQHTLNPAACGGCRFQFVLSVTKCQEGKVGCASPDWPGSGGVVACRPFAIEMTPLAQPRDLEGAIFCIFPSFFADQLHVPGFFLPSQHRETSFCSCSRRLLVSHMDQLPGINRPSLTIKSQPSFHDFLMQR